jgi:hypothetical protein
MQDRLFKKPGDPEETIHRNPEYDEHLSMEIRSPTVKRRPGLLRQDTIPKSPTVRTSGKGLTPATPRLNSPLKPIPRQSMMMNKRPTVLTELGLKTPLMRRQTINMSPTRKKAATFAFEKRKMLTN